MIDYTHWKAKRSMAECDAILERGNFAWEWKNIKGQRLRVYRHLPNSLRDLFLSSRVHGDKVYLIHEDDRLTFTQTHTRVEKIASALLSSGCRKGDRVGIAARNLVDWVTAFWAIQMIGGIAVCLNAWLPEEGLVYCINKTQCKLVFVDQERAERLQHSRISCHKVLIGSRIGKAAQLLDDWIANSRSHTDLGSINIQPEDLAVIFFTSGTTGFPKAAFSTQRQYLTNLLNAATGSQRAILRRGDSIPPPDPNALQPSCLLTIPLFHVSGNQSTLAMMTASGGKICMLPKWDVKEAVRLIRKEKIRSVGGVPSQTIQLLETDLQKGSTLEGMSFGGTIAATFLPSKVNQMLKAPMVAAGYGSTETNSVACAIFGEDYITRPTSSGVPCIVNDIKIIDPATEKEVSVGQEGEIVFRGPNVFSGYWGEEEATKKAFTKEGYFRMGDIGKFDQEGFIYITDRLKDIIIRGGENISASTVEQAIFTDSRLIDVSVVSVPHQLLGEEVAAVCVTKPAYHGQISEEDIKARCTKLLPKYAVPVFVIIQEELIERSATGKIVKGDLKKKVGRLYAERQVQQKATKAHL